MPPTRRGITALRDCSIINGVVNGNAVGIELTSSTTVSGCTVTTSIFDGIKAAHGCRIVDNNCSENGVSTGAGIHITGSDNRVESNHVSQDDAGIDVDAGGNIIIKNSASGNSLGVFNYEIVAGNTVGEILDFNPGPGDV